jgi:hypothetical protein
MLLHRAGTALLALLAGFALTAPAARGHLLDLQSQTRTVGIQIDHHERHWTCFPYSDPYCEPDFVITTNYSDDDVAPDAGPWVATASLAQFPDTFASQDSEITGRWIRVSGSQRATSYYDAWEFPESPIIDIEEPHSSATSFSATFVVATAGRYRLRGSVSIVSGLWSASTAFIRLTGPGAQVVAEVQLSRSWESCVPWPDCSMMGPEPITASGVLPPGTYTLEAGSTGEAQGYAKFGFSDVASGDFDLEFVLGPLGPDFSAPVPALSNGGLAILGVSLVCAARWLARRQRMANA